MGFGAAWPPRESPADPPHSTDRADPAPRDHHRSTAKPNHRRCAGL